MKIVFAFACAVCLVTVAFAQEAAKAQVALIGTGLSESGAAAVELAEAKLSVRPDLVLLDRRTIDSVLQEQKLQADGLVSAADAIRFGQLLSVDLFVHVEPIPGQPAVAVVAYETAQGIRLLDEMAGGTDAEAMASDIETAVVHAMAKWQAPAGQTTAIALMSVRNVDLPRSRNAECDSLGTLLERRLLGSPEVVVVERQRLESLNRDREVTMDRPEGRLLSAPVLLELDVEQAGKGEGFRAAAHLSDANGTELGDVRAGAKALPALADKLSANILSLLKKAETPPPSEPGLEAARFFQVARFWKGQGRLELAQAAAEAAFALDPTNPVMQVLLVNALYGSANANMASNRPDALAYAARGIALSRQPMDKPGFSDPEQEKQHRQLAADNDGFFRGFGRAVGESRDKNPFSAEESATYAEFCRDWLATSPFSPDAQTAVSSWDLLLFLKEGDPYYYFSDGESAWRSFAASMKRWCRERMAKDPPHLTPSLFAALIHRGDPSSFGIPVDPCVRADLIAFMNEQEDPLIRLYGRCGSVVDAARSNDQGSWAATPESQALLNDIHSRLLARVDAPGVSAEQLYKIEQIVIQRSGQQIGACRDHRPERTRQQVVEMVRLFQVMLETGEVRKDVITGTKNLLLNINGLGLEALGRKCLAELNTAMTEAARNPAESIPADQLEELKAFHDWVRETLEPGSTLPPPASNAHLEPVEFKKMPGHFNGIAALVDDDEGGYVLSAYKEPCRLFLQKWMPASGPRPMGAVDLRGPRRMDPMTAGVLDACRGKSEIAVAVRDEGVFLFARNSSAVEVLHETTSLPLAHPLSVGILGSVLYVGTDDGYLVSFDLETRAGDILVASSRKEKKSPFDDGSPVHVSALIPDPQRGRLVFVASVVDPESQLGMAVSDMGGIWEYRLDTGEFKQLVPWRHRPIDFRWCDLVQDDAFVVCDISGLVLRFDLESNAWDLLSMGKNTPGVFVRQLIQTAGLDQPRPGTVPVEQRTAGLAPPFLEYGEWLWTANPWGRLSMKTYQWEQQPSFRLADGSLKNPAAPAGMIRVGHDRILLADRFQLWLMTTEGKP